MSKKLKKDIADFVGAGIGLSIGSGIVAKAQAGSGINITPALSSAAGMMNPVGTAMMGGHALRMIGKLNPKHKKKKYRR